MLLVSCIAFVSFTTANKLIHFKDKEDQYERNRLNRKHELRRKSDRREAILDEVAPKETGREAALAKKRAINSYHKRERSPDVELSEQELMGGDDFKARYHENAKLALPKNVKTDILI